jgi:hypothetical protein
MSKSKKVIEFASKREAPGAVRSSLSLNYEADKEEKRQAFYAMCDAAQTIADNWGLTKDWVSVARTVLEIAEVLRPPRRTRRPRRSEMGQLHEPIKVRAADGDLANAQTVARLILDYWKKWKSAPAGSSHETRLACSLGANAEELAKWVLAMEPAPAPTKEHTHE